MRKMNLIVAMDKDGGIGKNGQLPWRLREDMKYFAKTTKDTNDKSKRNAVIMGRKCWDSIPQKFRPLPHRLNIVLSRSLPEKQSENLIICDDMKKVSEILASPPYANSIETLWNIGGCDVYKYAINNDLVDNLFVTFIKKSFDADVKLEDICFDNFHEVTDHEYFNIEQEEDGTTFKFGWKMVNNKGKKRGGGGDNSKSGSSHSGSTSGRLSNGERRRDHVHGNGLREHKEKEFARTAPSDDGGAYNHSEKTERESQRKYEKANGTFWQDAKNGSEVSETSRVKRNEKESQAPLVAVSSTASQTAFFTGDVILAYLEQTMWEKVEIICELVPLLSPVDLRLLASCVEAAVRANSQNVKHLESRANSAQPLLCFPQPSTSYSIAAGGTPSLFEILDALYTMIALLNPNNRRSAFQFARYVDSLVMAERQSHLSRIPQKEDQLRAIEMMGRVASACVHHPAFASNERLRFVVAREELRCEVEKLCDELELSDMTSNVPRESPELPKMRSTPSPTSPSQSPNAPLVPFSSMVFVYIRRFVGSQVEPNDQKNFHIQMIWSDGERTWTQRTREELKDLHYRLLDTFGDERKEVDALTTSMAASVQMAKEQGTAPSYFTESCASMATSVKGEEKSRSASTSVNSSNAEASSRRILPYFDYHADASSIVQYINDLSDLPARMMLSATMYEEFHATRMKTCDVQVSEKTNSRSVTRTPPVRRHSQPLSYPHTSSYAEQAMSYGVLPVQHMQVYQVVEPSCSNCAENHPFVFCNKPSFIEKQRESTDYKMDLSPIATPMQMPLPVGQQQQQIPHPFAIRRPPVSSSEVPLLDGFPINTTGFNQHSASR
ncbi:unnamed protein product [Caenorhabditis auriculariae]|uniref:dihydrofolate reductase n=1 Tax=Caenorhabditis auriculariae TaxID=2777116 RepID=A0A8S1GRX9_9PELO|nr:unnamed protein product [Caenorhabditis auriculariae]